MTDDLDRIDALAKAAQVGAGLWYFSDSREIDGEIDATYIAALDPQTWLAFSARLRRAEAVVEAAEAALGLMDRGAYWDEDGIQPQDPRTATLVWEALERLPGFNERMAAARPATAGADVQRHAHTTASCGFAHPWGICTGHAR